MVVANGESYAVVSTVTGRDVTLGEPVMMIEPVGELAMAGPAADDEVAYLPLPKEDNPFLGLRGIRVALLQPELMRHPGARHPAR
ncbi:MAG: PEP-utilizing enzyme, barrel domain [Proteobacteria bacterium]|nr:PEP-utilizing enzyme, barrel domain [Pseudomonadota bacterium]